MFGFLREHSGSMVLSVLLHGSVVAALVFVSQLSLHRPPPNLQPLAITAMVVNSQVLHAASQAQSLAAAAAAKVAADERARAAADAQAQKDAQAAAEAKAAADAKVAADNKAAADAKAAQVRAEVAQAAADAEARERAEAARAAKAAADAKAVDDAKKLADAKRATDAKAPADAKRAADERARKDREAELRRQLAEEEHVSEVEQGPLADRYRASLANRITRAWIKPPSAHLGIDCRVEVTQVPGGEVTGARVTQCNGDAAVRQSIENAVYRASPLPDPPDPALFQRTFVFEFKPDE